MGAGGGRRGGQWETGGAGPLPVPLRPRMCARPRPSRPRPAGAGARAAGSAAGGGGGPGGMAHPSEASAHSAAAAAAMDSNVLAIVIAASEWRAGAPVGPGGGGRRAGSASAVASRGGLVLCRRNDSPTHGCLSIAVLVRGSAGSRGCGSEQSGGGGLAVPDGLRGAERGLGGSRGFPKAGALANRQPAGVPILRGEPRPRAGGHRGTGSPVPAGPVPAAAVRDGAEPLWLCSLFLFS